MNTRLPTGHLQRLALFGAAVSICAVGSSAAVSRNHLASVVQPSSPSQKATTTKTIVPPKVGEIAPDFQLKGLKDETIRLSRFTKAGPVVLVMLRGYPGYQCPFCTMQVGELIVKAKQFAKANTRVILVYPGPTEELKAHADEFVRGKDVPANFYLALDPNYKFTKQYGLRWDAKGETSYPSTFVLNTKRKILFAKISRTHDDRAKADDVLAALPK